MAENGSASLADDDGLGVRENGGDGEAAGALDIHEERPGSRDQSLVVACINIDHAHSSAWVKFDIP